MRSRGGIGNQLFQLSFAVLAQESLGGSLIIAGPKDSKDNDPNFRNNNLAFLNMARNPKTKFSTNGWSPNPIETLVHTFHDANLKLPMVRAPFSDRAFLFDSARPEHIERVKKMGVKRLVLSGYWITPLYADKVLNANPEAFKIEGLVPRRLGILEQYTGDENSVAIHIRRGDYLSPHLLKSYGILTPEFFIKAIDSFLRDRTPSKVRLFFFSDDMDWVRSQVLTRLNPEVESFLVMQQRGEEAVHHLHLMSQFTNLIISNSTFSWWATRLGPKKRLVISPDDWGQRLPKALISPEWKLMQAS